MKSGHEAKFKYAILLSFCSTAHTLAFFKALVISLDAVHVYGSERA